MEKNLKTWGLTLYLSYVLTILLVLVTLFAILLRVGIGQLEENPQWIKSWLSSQLDAEITFEDLDISSFGNTISLGLKNLNMRSNQNQESLLRATEIQVKINWLKSAFSFALETSQIKLKSPFISLIRHLDGRFSIGNMPSLKKGNLDTTFNRWLFKQKHVQMSDLELNFHSKRFNKDWYIKKASLVVAPKGKQRQMEIHSSFLNQGWLRIRMQWSGKLGQVDGWGSWGGWARVNGKNLPADLIASFAPNKFINLHQSLIDINSQFKWQKGQIKFGFGQLEMQHTLLTNSQTNNPNFKALYIPNISTDFQVRTIGKLTKTNLNIKLPELKNAPAQSFSLFALLFADKANIVSTSIKPSLIEYFSDLYPDKTRQIINALKPQGAINHLQVSIPYAKNQTYKAKLVFSDLAFNASEKTPGFSPSSGSIDIDGKNIYLAFNADKLAIDFPAKFFRNPIKVGKTTGSVTLSLKDNKQWIASADKIIANIHDANAALAFRIKSLTDSQKPFIELVANFNATAANRVHEYLPVKIMSPKAVKWLDQAFSTATVSNGLARLHGNLNKYPFVDKTDGKQFISMEIENGALFYQAGWPKIKNISGHLAFDELGMLCSIKNADSAGVKLESAHANITNFKALPSPKLELRLDSQASLPTLQKYLKQTPLNKIFAKTLSTLKINGGSKLKLAINMPLKKPANGGKIIPKIAGALRLNYATVKVLPLELELSKLSGEINFTENSIEADKVNGYLLGGNFNGKITTVSAFDKSNGLIKIDASGMFTSKKINTWAKFLTPDISGNANWKTQLKFAKNGKHRAKISSNLQGTTVFMPNIINKSKNKSLATSANINWDSSNTTIAFDAQNIAKAYLQKRKNHTWVGGISLFSKKIQTNKSGILISGNLPLFNFNSWKKWLTNNSKTTKKSLQKISFKGAINKLILGQTSFNKANINGQHYQGKWSADFKTRVFSGKVVVPPAPAPISINLNRYVLNTGSTTGKSSTLDTPQTKILLEIKSLILDNKNLGRFKVALIPTTSGAKISNLSLRSAAFNLSGSGTWSKKTNNSRLNIKLSAKKLQSFLRAFGYTGKIKNAATNMTLIARWRGSPLSFSLKKINGTGKINISNGEFLEIGSSGKSLLYLLKLNLSGIRKKGLDFRNITGNYSLNNGIVSSKSIKLNSVAAAIEFKNTANLIRQTFNMQVTIVPKLGGTLPLVGAATAGVPGLVAGGVVAVIDKISGNGISKIVRKKLKITGSWTRPIVKKLGKAKQKSDNTLDTDLLGIPIND